MLPPPPVTHRATVAPPAMSLQSTYDTTYAPLPPRVFCPPAPPPPYSSHLTTAHDLGMSTSTLVEFDPLPDTSRSPIGSLSFTTAARTTTTATQSAQCTATRETAYWAADAIR